MPKIFIPGGDPRAPGPKLPVELWINGRRHLLPENKEVEVTESVLGALRDSRIPVTELPAERRSK